MGNKSKMCGATSKTFGVSKRNTRNGGAFGRARWKNFEMIVEVHSRHPKGKISYEKQMVPMRVISHGYIFLKKAKAMDGQVL